MSILDITVPESLSNSSRKHSDTALHRYDGQHCRHAASCSGNLSSRRFDQASISFRRRLRIPSFFLHIFVLFLLVVSIGAAFVPFENCLDPSTKTDPQKLQFTPLFVAASLDTSSLKKTLNVTIYGNVTGTADKGSYPAPGDPQWSDRNATVGKIPDVDDENFKRTTLYTRLDVASFTPKKTEPTSFCDSVVQGQCPLGPVFNANQSDISQLRSFSFSHDLFSGYSFTSILSTARVALGDKSATPVGCITSDIVPGLGQTLRDAIRFTPVVILILVGIATISAAIYSPWGSTDIFRWTSNYGRDEDLLRLVTPGFGDCLQYIQFVILTGSLSLNYPGYFQPVVSQAGWSVLMFNQSFVSQENGTQPLVDGVYGVNGTYGLDRMRQYIGMAATRDVWTGMVIYLLGIIAGVVLLIQLGFSLRWVHHKAGRVEEEDLRAKNMPFTVGNVIRVVFNYFLLPVVSLSMFQLVIAGSSPVFTVALAVVLLVVLIGFASWLLFLIAKTRPRSYLFDDLPTVLIYGPLYNTFSDGAAPFAWISVLLNFVRGIAIGAVQPSGIAQIVLLAICEVTLVLTIAAFRPFQYPTSMNAYHTFFAIVRCLTLLLSVSFVPSLKVADSVRSWIGYVILLMHGIILVFGFFINAVQTLVEVIARLAGAGGEGGAEGAARGGLVKVFGMRQLSRRTSRKRRFPRHSMNSEAAMLGGDVERPSTQLDRGHTRSFSNSSAVLLGGPVGPSSRLSAGFDNSSAGHSRGNGSLSYTPTTPGGVSGPSGRGGTGSPRSGFLGFRHPESADPYYRPPRKRRATLDGMSPTHRRHSSWTSGDWAKRDSDNAVGGDDSDHVDGPSASGRGTPTPAYLPAPRDDLDGDGDEHGQPRTDYAVREVDFYYHVRGPALSHSATRKLKTGPADPTAPAYGASGWLRNMFRGKTKEKNKGFEVVRSARAPPAGLMLREERDVFPEPYRDEPDSSKGKGRATEQNENDDGDSDQERPKSPTPPPPSLPPIVTTDAIELPNRAGSKNFSKKPQDLRIRPPTIPRKSSKRNSAADMPDHVPGKVPAASQATKPPPGEGDETPRRANQRGSGEPTGRLPFGSQSSSTHSGHISESGSSNMRNDEEATPRATRHNRKTSGFESFSSQNRADRPSSLGYVQQHRASDNIHNTSPSRGIFSESTAEIVRNPSDSVSSRTSQR